MAVECSPVSASNDLRWNRPVMLLPVVALLGVFLVIITRRAWVGDDAYITFRTVDNFINGYALTWNVGERVQAYTHPLWMFLLSASYFVTREMYFTSVVVSLLVSLAAVSVVALRLARSTAAAALGVLALALSNAFVDYSTSGLENPLTHLLLAVFYGLYFGTGRTPRRLFWLSLVASLGGVNRMDTLLIYAPALLLAWWETPPRGRALGAAALGQLPFILWEIFSLVYYGFPFPNTAYAKLNTGVPGGELAAQGLFYYLHSLQFDPLTLVVIFGSLALALTSRQRRSVAAGLGVLFYLLYIVKIGGDFMSGRFFSAPLLAAVVLLGRFDFSRMGRSAVWGLGVGLVLLGLAAPLPTYRIDLPDTYSLSDERRINDERAWYFPDVSLMGRSRLNPYPTSQGRQGGLAARAEGEKDYYVVPVNNIGLYGFYAGPRVYVIDEYALADPLLARLPAEREADFYVGHFHRSVPAGYVSTIYTGKNQLEDENLAKFYDQLKLIVRGPLFSGARWAAIWRMNTGQLNGWIDQDAYRHPEMARLSLAEASQPVNGQIYEFNDSGIQVEMGGLVHASVVVLRMDSQAAFRVEFRRSGETSAVVELPGTFSPVALSEYRVGVPLQAARRGFEQVRILPLRGQKLYHLGAFQILE